jgi:hypothetical protein
VFVLCQKKQDKLLCKLGFDNFQTEVKNSLTKLAEISDIEEMRRYWKLLYSYAVMRRDYSTGTFSSTFSDLNSITFLLNFFLLSQAHLPCTCMPSAWT